MVVLSKIYTRTGDDGTTGLAGGVRRAKHDLRIEAIGTVDEANAAIGLAITDRQIAGNTDLCSLLARIQNDLFDLGADLARPEQEKGETRSALRIQGEQVEALEADIDRLNGKLPALRSFILPGGRPAAAALHLARTIVRRAERLVCALAGQEAVTPAVRLYLNRLSDLLFVAARAVNAADDDSGTPAGDVLWRPGGGAGGNAGANNGR